MSDVEEMSEADLKAEVEHNQWSQDMAVEEAVNAVKPDTSPVCVEVKGLLWMTVPSGRTTMAESAFGVYEIYQASDGYQAQLVNEALFAEHQKTWICVAQPTLEAAQAACDADHERRVLELINARSMADVRAECADQIANLAAEAERCGLTDKTEHFRIAEREVRYGARALTEGEG